MKVEQLTFNIPAGRRRFLYRFFTPAFCLACIALLFFSPVSSDAARDVPGYKGYVNDYASMISSEVRTNLEKTLHSFDLSDSTQVAILTIHSLEGEPIEDFSIRVVDQWKIGQQGKDNGVLFLVAKNDRKMRIEVGRGLEHVLTDLAAGRIIDRVVAPLFKEGRFDEGFEAGITAIIQTTRGEYTHPPENSGSGKSPQFVNYLFFGGVLLYFLSSNSRALGAMGGAVLLPLLFYLGLPGLLNWPIVMILVPVGALIGLMFSFLLSAIPKHSGRSSRGGFYTGGFGGYSGGSFGGGGFGGFGGGSFGGGGASGGW